MKKINHHFLLITVLTFCLITFQFSFAVNETASGWYGIYAHSGLQEIYGEYVNSESYSCLGALEDYDPGYLDPYNGWGSYLTSDTSITNSQGTVEAFSQTPNTVGAWMQHGYVDFNLSDSVEAVAWTNTQSVYSPDSSGTIEVEFMYGLTEGVNLYFGVWVDGIIDYVILDEIDGWNRVDLDYQGQRYNLLKYTGPTTTDGTTYWPLGLESGRDYTFFTYLEAEIIPEPATVFLLCMGGLMVRRRK